jgi:hypothetical protein
LGKIGSVGNVCRARTGKQVFLGCLDLRVYQVLQEIRAFRVPKENKDRWDIKDQLDFRERGESKVTKGNAESKEKKEIRVIKEQKGKRESRVRKEMSE